MRAIRGRAWHNGARRTLLLSATCAGLLLAGCANDGVFPVGELPSAPPGPPPPFPTFSSPADHAADDTRVLTTAEREAMEAELSKLASEREAGVRRRIERGK